MQSKKSMYVHAVILLRSPGFSIPLNLWFVAVKLAAYLRWMLLSVRLCVTKTYLLFQLCLHLDFLRLLNKSKTCSQSRIDKHHILPLILQEILKSLVAAPVDGGELGQESGPTPYHPDPALKTHPMLPMQFHSFDRWVPVF